MIARYSVRSASCVGAAIGHGNKQASNIARWDIIFMRLAFHLQFPTNGDRADDFKFPATVRKSGETAATVRSGISPSIRRDGSTGGIEQATSGSTIAIIIHPALTALQIAVLKSPLSTMPR
jgi:hypothetical protein